MSCIKKKSTKTPQEEAQDVAQETSQEERKTWHEELKQTEVHRSRLGKGRFHDNVYHNASIIMIANYILLF